MILKQRHMFRKVYCGIVYNIKITDNELLLRIYKQFPKILQKPNTQFLKHGQKAHTGVK